MAFSSGQFRLKLESAFNSFQTGCCRFILNGRLASRRFFQIVKRAKHAAEVKPRFIAFNG